MTAKKPAAKKVTKKPDRPAPLIFLVRGADCENGDVFHSRQGDNKGREAWCESADVFGPFVTVAEGLDHIDKYETELPEAVDKTPAIFAVIGDGPMYKITAQIDHKIDIQSYFSE